MYGILYNIKQCISICLFVCLFVCNPTFLKFVMSLAYMLHVDTGTVHGFKFCNIYPGGFKQLGWLNILKIFQEPISGVPTL